MLPSGTPSVPAALAIRAMPAPSRLDEEIIEFELDAMERSADYLLVIGSLGEAADVNTVRLSWRSNSDRGREMPLNHTPGLAICSRQLNLSQTAKSAWRIQYPAAPNIAPTARRVFFLQLGSDPYSEGSYQPVETRLLACSSRISIWRETADRREEAAEDVSWLADCLEQVVLPKIARLYGTITDLDGDRTLSVCLTRRLAELPATGVPVEGLVQFNDFLPELDRPFSNQADVLFLSADLAAGPHATAILAHEAAHLAVFSRRRDTVPRHHAPDEDWLNEGLAHYAETVCGGDWSNLLPRIAAFQQSPGLSALVVPDAAQQGLWRDPAARGAAWAFVSWLAQEHGEVLLRQIASQDGTGCEKITRITGQPFEELFRQWTLAMWLTATTVKSDSNLQQGLRFSGRFATNAASASEVILLRGFGHVGHHVALDRGERARFRITAPKQARAQVTLVERNVVSPRYWLAR